MKKFAILAAGMLVVGVIGCSDNLNSLLNGSPGFTATLDSIIRGIKTDSLLHSGRDSTDHRGKDSIAVRHGQDSTDLHHDGRDSTDIRHNDGGIGDTTENHHGDVDTTHVEHHGDGGGIDSLRSPHGGEQDTTGHGGGHNGDGRKRHR